MFHPTGHSLERGWVGRIEDDHVVHLAAQTLQSFFSGGGSAREHAVYRLAEVRLLAPVLHPPAVRVFDNDESFEFANPAAIVGPGAAIEGGINLSLLPRLAAVIATDGQIGGYTILAEWRKPALERPKDRDFALGLGPVVVTTEDFHARDLGGVVRVDGVERLSGGLDGFDYARATGLAARGTKLVPGDLLAGPPIDVVEDIASGNAVEIELDGIGTLAQTVRPDIELG